MSKISNIGPLSVLSYISFTLIFFVIKGVILPTSGQYWIVIFFIVTGLIQFINNLYLTNMPEICGEYNISNALLATLIPWIFIFGIICLCLVVLPGWLRVFSNTFGVSIAYMAGLKEVTTTLLSKPQTESANTDFEMKKILELIYSNPQTIINEIDISDYNDDDTDNPIWPSLDKVMGFLGKTDYKTSSGYKDNVTKLFKLLSLKEDVGYFVWFILIGSISVLVSTNSLLVSKCSTNALLN